VQPHAQREALAKAKGQRVSGQKPMQALVQIQGREHGTPGMILLRHWRAKHGREAIIPMLGDGTLVVLYHLLGERGRRL
jgi:hypothetical protein